MYGGSSEAERALEEKKRADGFVPQKREKDPVLNNANFGVESSASKLRSVGGAQTPRRKKAAAKDIYVSEEETPYRRKKKTPVRDVSEDDESPSRRRKKPGREESEEEEPHIGRKN